MRAPSVDQRALAVVDLGLLGLRTIGLAVLLAAIVAVGPRSFGPVDLVVLLVVIALVVAAQAAAQRLEHRGVGAERAVAAQLALDLTATVGALLVFDPPPGHGAWAIIALPVLEGSLRHGTAIGATTWLAASIPVTGWTIAHWSPGDGVGSLADTAIALVVAVAIGLPAGRGADRVLEALAETDADRAEIGRRGLLIGASSSFTRRLTEVEGPELCRVAARAAVELGFPTAEVALIDKRSGQRQPIAVEPALTVGLAPLADLSGPELAATIAADPPAVIDGEHDTTIGVLGGVGDQVTILRVANRAEAPWPPRREAFELLTIHAATGLSVGSRLAEAERPLSAVERPVPARDQVTGLLDRIGGLQALADVLAAIPPGQEARVVVLDLERFAWINATFGWEVGDEVLHEVAARLRRTSPEGAVVARLEADRFAVATADPGATYLAEHLCDVLARPLATSAGSLTPTLTIGLALSGDLTRRGRPLDDAIELVGQAEARARGAKPQATGANPRVESFPSPQPPDLPRRRTADRTPLPSAGGRGGGQPS